jgi:MFS family permease
MKPDSQSSIGEVSNRVLYLVAMNHAVNDGSVFLLTSLFPIVLSLFGLSVFQIGILVGTGYLVSVILQPLIGRYSEGRDPKVFLALGIFIISLSVFSFVLSSDFLSLLGSVALLRAGSSFFHPVGIAAVSREYSGSKLDRAMGFQSAFGNLGIFLVFISAAPIYLAFGWKETFLLFALIGIADITVTLSFFSPTLSTNPLGPTGKVGAKSKVGRLGIPLFFPATTFISGGSFAVLLNYANIYLQKENHLGVSLANGIVSVWIASAFVGAIVSGRGWSKMMKRGLLLSVFFLVAAVTIIAFTFAYASIPLEIVLLAANGFALSATYPLTYSELSEFLHFDPERKGRAFGIIFSAQTIGSSILGLISGYVSDLFGLSFAFWEIGLVTLLGGAIVLAWVKQTKPLPASASPSTTLETN